MELNKKILKVSNLVTISSYVKGTLIFTLFTISSKKNEQILIIGLGFVAFAIIVNLVMLLISLGAIYFSKTKEIKNKLWFAISLQLANIPIAIGYFYYVINDINVI